MKTTPKTPFKGLISISLDWFQTHNTSTPYLEGGTCGNFTVKNLGRLAEFKNHYEIFLGTERVATLAAHPDKGVLKPDTSFLKIDNKFLYQNDLKGLVTEINSALCLKFRNVSRVDIACDFNLFKNRLHPETFIERFIPQRKPKYVKLRRCVWSLVGKHQRGRRGKFNSENSYGYIRFGNPRSNICYYLYNKTAEMRDKKNKPWIADKWKADNLDLSEVWRLEFRIHSCSKGIIDQDSARELKRYRAAKKFSKHLDKRTNADALKFLKFIADSDALELCPGIDKAQHVKNYLAGIAAPTIEAAQQSADLIELFETNKDDITGDAKYFSSLDVLDNYNTFYAALFNHYFDFRHNDGQAKKRRMKRLPLLDIKKPNKVMMELAEKLESNRTDKMLLKKLVNLNNELRNKVENPFAPTDLTDRETFFNNIKTAVEYYSNSRDLVKWMQSNCPI